MSEPAMTLERLAEFGDAWRRKDLDALMEFMANDCEFRASVGPEPGATFIGRDEVRRGFELMLRYDQAAEGHGGHAFVNGAFGASQWSFSRPAENGTTLEVRGCDLYEFDGDRIRIKDAYRKVLGEIDRGRRRARQRLESKDNGGADKPAADLRAPESSPPSTWSPASPADSSPKHANQSSDCAAFRMGRKGAPTNLARALGVFG